MNKCHRPNHSTRDSPNRTFNRCLWIYIEVPLPRLDFENHCDLYLMLVRKYRLLRHANNSYSLPLNCQRVSHRCKVLRYAPTFVEKRVIMSVYLKLRSFCDLLRFTSGMLGWVFFLFRFRSHSENTHWFHAWNCCRSTTQVFSSFEMNAPNELINLLRSDERLG